MQPNPWPDSKPLLDINGKDVWRLRKAFEGVVILGSTGSGKTSGPFQYIIRSLLRSGAGGLFLCVKSDAAQQYRRWIEQEGRKADLVRFTASGNYSFNFLDYILNQESEVPPIDEAVAVLFQVLDLLYRQNHPPQHDNEQRFFRQSATAALREVMTIVFAANRTLELETICDLISELPRTAADADPDSLRNRYSKLHQLISQAEENATGEQAKQVAQARHFCLHDWPQYGQDTRESVRATIQVDVSHLRRPPLLGLFGSTSLGRPGQESVTPADIIGGKLVVVDISLYGGLRQAGQTAAIIWKTMLQRALLARSTAGSDLRPVFIAADEAQEIVSEPDHRFASSSRGHRGITVYATQTISQLEHTLGKTDATSLLANLKTRFICRCGHPETAKWFAESINQKVAPNVVGMFNAQMAIDETIELIHRLQEGGGRKQTVEAVMAFGGDELAANQRWFLTTFRQNLPRFPLSLIQKYATNNVRILG